MTSFSTIKGNVGRDPEIRTTQNGTKVATFSVGVNRQAKDNTSSTDWFNCVAWGDQADVVEGQIKKGMYLIITGKFQTRSYDDKDGKRVYVTELFVDDIAQVLKKTEAKMDNPFADPELPF